MLRNQRGVKWNTAPSLPTGECAQFLEKMRAELLSDVRKRNNRETMGTKMDRTFHALFDAVEVCALINNALNRCQSLCVNRNL